MPSVVLRQRKQKRFIRHVEQMTRFLARTGTCWIVTVLLGLLPVMNASCAPVMLKRREPLMIHIPKQDIPQRFFLSLIAVGLVLLASVVALYSLEGG